MVTAVLAVLCGGAGAILRFVLDGVVQDRRVGEFPLGTLFVNVGGAFLLGMLAGLHVSHLMMLIVGTATIGSYTTFSTWMLEIHRPLEDGEPVLAGQNFVVSVALGLSAVAAGRAIGGLL